ncbi:MAG: hypothetical protein QM768_04145 [Agriterribacter sp.]
MLSKLAIDELISIKKTLKEYYPMDVHPFENLYENTREYKYRIEKVKFNAEATKVLYNNFLLSLKSPGIFLAYDFTMIPYMHRCRTFIIKESFSSSIAHIFHLSLLMPYYFSYTAILGKPNFPEAHLPGCLDFSNLEIVENIFMDNIEQKIQIGFHVTKLNVNFLDEKIYDRVYIKENFRDDCTIFFGLFMDDYLMHSY